MARRMRFSCFPDTRIYLQLAKRANEQGVSVSRYVSDYFASFFDDRGVSETPARRGQKKRLPLCGLGVNSRK